MNPLVYALLAAIAVGAAGFALVPALMGSSRADKRIKALQGDIQANRRDADVQRTRDSRRKQIQDTLKAQNEALGRARRRVSLQDQINQAGMKISARNWVRNQIIVGGVVAVAMWLLHVPCYFPLVFGAADATCCPSSG